MLIVPSHQPERFGCLKILPKFEEHDKVSSHPGNSFVFSESNLMRRFRLEWPSPRPEIPVITDLISNRLVVIRRSGRI